MEPLAYQSIRALRKQLTDGTLSAGALAKDCALQHRVRHQTLGAYHLFDQEKFEAAATTTATAWEAGRSGSMPLCGIPFSVKSVIAVEDYPCYAGTSRPLPEAYISQGEFINSLKRAGGVVSGITHAAEFAVGGLGVNEHWPTPRNPWDVNHPRVPGGSSSGAAISVWEGSCVFAIGTDTGGSVRVPASAGGLAGLKTTTGRWPVSGVVPLAHRFDSIGVIAHRVSDLVDVFSAVEGRPIAQRAEGFDSYKVRRASAVCWENLDAGIMAAIESAIEQLCNDGMRLQSEACDIHQQASLLRSADKPNSAAIESHALLNGALNDYQSSLGLHVREFIQSEAHRPAEEHHARVAEIIGFQARVRSMQSDYDITLAPTLCYTPPTLEHVTVRENHVHYSDALLHNTVLVSMCKQCALTMPVGLDDSGVPVGLQIIAPQGCDELLLQFGLLVEQTLGEALVRLGLPPLLRQR